MQEIKHLFERTESFDQLRNILIASETFKLFPELMQELRKLIA